REAAAAHLVVVNHALLLTDLSLRDQIGQGILPLYQRLVLDEGHHLEDAATGATSRQLSSLGIRRAIVPLLDRRKRTGALGRLVDLHAGTTSALPAERRPLLQERVDLAQQQVFSVVAAADTILSDLAEDATDRNGNPRRITPEIEGTDRWADETRPHVEALTAALQEAAGA